MTAGDNSKLFFKRMTVSFIVAEKPGLITSA